MVLGIYGAGGFGKEIYDMVSLWMSDKWEEVVYVDDIYDGTEFRGARIMPYEAFRKEFSPKNGCIVIAQGNPHNKQVLYEKVKADGFSLPILVHPQAYVANDAFLDEGVIVFIGCSVSSSTKVGKCSAILTNSLIGHDAVIEDFCQISAMVLVNGNVKICNETFIGGGALIRDHLTIGENSIVAMGACVMKDVNNGTMVMGNPARTIKKSEDVELFKM